MLPYSPARLQEHVSFQNKDLVYVDYWKWVECEKSGALDSRLVEAKKLVVIYSLQRGRCVLRQAPRGESMLCAGAS